jgi:tellurite resistance protein
LATIPPELAAAAREPFGARVVAMAMLMSDDESVRAVQVQSLRSSLNAATVDEVLKIAPATFQMDRSSVVALMDLIQPALKQLSANQLQEFASATKALTEADGRVTLFEYAMYRQLRRQLDAARGKPMPSPVQFYSLRPLLGDAVTVLSALAYSGKDPAHGADAFQAGLARLDAPEHVLAANDYGLGAVDAALNRLAQASAGVKRRIVDAAAHAVAEDGLVQPEEAQLLRAICAALEVPLPIASA